MRKHLFALGGASLLLGVSMLAAQGQTVAPTIPPDPAAFDAQGNSLGQQVFGGPRVDSFAPRGLTVSGGVIHAVGSTRNAANSNDGYLTRWTLLP